MIKIFLALLLVGFQASADSADDLLQVFGGQCFTNGPLRNQALNQSQNLSAIIQNIKNDSKCKGISSAYDSFAAKLGDFNAFTRAAKISELEGNIQDLNSALVQEKAKGADADKIYITDLQTSLSSLRQELFTASQSKDIDQRKMQIEALRGVHEYSNKLISAVSSSQECLDGHPNLGLQVGAQLLGVAGQYTAGLVSGGLIAGASIIDNLVSFFHNQKYNKELKNLDLARKSEAVGCALEAVSRTMCQSRDYLALLNAKSEGTVCVECEKYEGGLKVLKQQLQSYSVWVQRLSAGTAATTPGQAVDKNMAYQLQLRYDSFVTNVDVIISQGATDLAGTTTPSVVLDNIFKDLRWQIETDGGTSRSCISSTMCFAEKGVLARTFARDPNCGPASYLRSNGKDFQCQLNPGEQCDACLIRNYGNTLPTFDQLKASVDSLKVMAQANIDIEKKKFVETDALLALSKVDTVQSNNFSARDFMKNTKAYFESRLADKDSVLQKSNILRQAVTDARDRIDSTFKILDKTTAFGKNDVLDISTQLLPANNFFFISDKLNELVQQEYAEVIKSKNTSVQNSGMAEYSVQESIATMLAQYGSRIAASAQAETAQKQSSQTLSSLENIFGKDMLKSIEANASSPTLLAVQCFRALMLPNFKDEATKKACANTELKAERGGKSYILKFKDLVNQPIGKRACGLYDFSRREQILSRSK